MTLTSCASLTPAEKQKKPVVTEKIETINKKLMDAENRLSQIEDKVALLNSATGKLDTRLADLDQKVMLISRQTAPSSDISPGVETAEDTDPVLIYQKARSLLLEENFKDAGILFREIMEQYPEHELADNSMYWLGECCYSLTDYKGAVKIFKALVEKYPKGGKVPDALLKTAYSYLSLDDSDRAHHYLKKVVKKYPFTPAGEKAEQKLKAFQ
ncbi:MAG: tol-pal system protein YbgF [Desulfobacteraceae bacterium]